MPEYRLRKCRALYPELDPSPNDNVLREYNIWCEPPTLQPIVRITPHEPMEPTAERRRFIEVAEGLVMRYTREWLADQHRAPLEPTAETPWAV